MKIKQIMFGISIGLAITCCILAAVDGDLFGFCGWVTSALWQFNYIITNP